MARCLLALGSNLGDRTEQLVQATREVGSLPKTELLAQSQWCETVPIGGPKGQGTFLNGSLLLETKLEPIELFGTLLEVERRLGRKRGVRWGARAIDIDMLLYDDRQIATDRLVLPHPQMSFRRFVLQPACEVAASMVHSASGWTLAQLLEHLDRGPRYVAIATAQSESARRLARELSRVLGCPSLEKLCPSTPLGPDSPPAEQVELSSGQVDSLRITRWRQTSALATRLPGCTKPTLLPVVSSFWHADAPTGLVRPALIIAWERATPLRGAAALTQILDCPGHGPMARIQGEDFPSILSEAVSAIRAAWPALNGDRSE